MTAVQNALELKEAIRKSQMNPLNDPRFASLEKSTFAESASATTGLTYYDLEAGAKLLFPVLTPLRNSIPRVSGKGGVQAAWRAITSVNSSGLRIGVSGGNRGGVAAMTTKEYVANYKGLGIETSVDFEAQYAGQGFDDLRALSAQTGLEALMIGEEAMILGGNGSMALGTTATPTLAASTTGGSLATSTLSVIAVALSHEGLINASVSSGIQASITRTNADGSSDSFGGGAARKSTNATVSVTGPTGAVTASVTVKSGAAGYAWFWGAAGSEVLAAITTINSVVITATATGAQTAASLPAADWSVNALAFDGLLTQAFNSGSGSLIVTQPDGVAGAGTPLTADGAGGIVEIENVLKANWDNYRLSPDEVWVSSQEAMNISKKVLSAGSNAAQRFLFDARNDAFAGGVMATTYKNKYSMAGAKSLDIKIHPNMPAGTMLFLTRQLPYPLANVGNVIQMRTRQDYYQIEWPLRARRYEYGVYADEVLQHYFPPSMSVITNIGNG
ncbi:hypothetical protein GJ654_10005 [Rhodoblastus acidophilus]|uniref:Uncharacterized protein n=1 Tax=Rhodoblastus acidophilus TaxID=1074 RepID=A0A6N8DN93_RHOAC|nr:hypothetical protein [Rhodoblastus acidophilus]MCW2275053.1 hypothetical protein [Rhodoblastus acidophilus]MTV31326.1 hypothetical protein [Rhodoblastus acidophilus]